MREEQYIKSLLEAAKTEAPKTSFEQVAARFKSSVETANIQLPEPEVKWWQKFLHLNTFLVALAGSVGLLSVFLLLKPAPPEVVAAQYGEPAKALTPVDDPTTRLEAAPNPEVVEQRKTRKSYVVTPPVEERGHKAERTLGQRPSPTSDRSEESVPDVAAEVPNDSVEKPVELKVPELRLSDRPLTPSLITSFAESTTSLTPTTLSARRPEIKHFVQLELHPTDTREAVLLFLATLESYGLDIDLSSSTLDKVGTLDKFVLKFRHERGMDFKLRTVGFGYFQIRLQLNAKRELEGFYYRFNEEASTDLVPLICKGHKKHIYENGHHIIGGTTNVPIGY